jgi:lysophospholipid acyltransferase (LPLAT)-like uncharacterized protein
LKLRPLFWRIAASFLAAYLKLCFKTQRVNFPDKESAHKFYESGEGGIIAFWHGRMAYMPHICPNPKRTYVLISRHNDGALIADIISRFGIQTIRGSTNRPSTHPKGAKNRGGRQAMTNSIKRVQEGNIFAITPDGPKGPGMKVYPGIIKIAEIAKAQILPISFSVSNGFTINSWDKFLFPLPFGRVEYRIGKPAIYDEATLEQVLNELTNECDKAVSKNSQ